MRIRYRIDPGTGGPTVATIQETLSARLGHRYRRREPWASLLLRWSARTPDRVRLAVDGAVWVLPRELFAAGLARRAGGAGTDGAGRLIVARFDPVADGPPARVLRLMGEDGPAALSFPVGPASRFLAASYGILNTRFGSEADTRDRS
ncbi:hypothetical protein [Pseudonocardia sp. SID8383]|uniref:hypothetical protein n=1 Tax=Pseudonocardia sp. SID8383 TaxID=2690363 RepID=UPI0013703B8B|nr:hypothetical protein [Pseudonocardia sp. SID8383]MYW73605.1 hypothetical protein [Pseudonocardia sp. SID8383]